MATRIESGRIQIASPGGVPMERVVPQQVDFMPAAREEARGAAAMADILDRMSTTVFGIAKEVTQEEALQFAARSPITDDQLILAKEGMPSAIPGLGKLSSDSTVFGRALKKARTLQLSGHFEMEGRNELTKLLAEVQNGKIKSKDVADKIAVISNGYANSLAKIDAEAAIKFRATMATHGNTVLNTAYESELKRKKAEDITKFDFDFDNSMRLLEATVSRGFWIDGQGNERSINDLASVIEKSVATQSLLIGDAAVQREYSEKFRVALRAAKVNAVTRYVLSDENLMADPIGTRKKIMSADLKKMGPVMADLLTNDMDAVAKIFANLEVAGNQRENANKDKKAAEKDAVTKQFMPLYIEAVRLPDTSPKRKELVGKINDIARNNPDAVPLGVLKDLNEPPKPAGEGAGSISVWSTLWNGIEKGEVTDISQIDKYRTQLSKEDYRSLIKHLSSDNRRDANQLEVGINRLADIPTIPGTVITLDEKGEKFKRRQELKARALEIQAQYEREGKAVTTRQILNDLETDIDKRRKTEGAAKARKTLDDVWSKQPWINGPITRKSLPALEQKAKGDTKKERDLAQIRKLLDQIEGGR
jgi:hypothetical protein